MFYTENEIQTGWRESRKTCYVCIVAKVRKKLKLPKMRLADYWNKYIEKFGELFICLERQSVFY